MQESQICGDHFRLSSRRRLRLTLPPRRRMPSELKVGRDNTRPPHKSTFTPNSLSNAISWMRTIPKLGSCNSQSIQPYFEVALLPAVIRSSREKVGVEGWRARPFLQFVCLARNRRLRSLLGRRSTHNSAEKMPIVRFPVSRPPPEPTPASPPTDSPSFSLIKARR